MISMVVPVSRDHSMVCVTIQQVELLYYHHYHYRYHMIVVFYFIDCLILQLYELAIVVQMFIIVVQTGPLLHSYIGL